MFSETHRPVNYRSILEIYLESAYFTREFEKFRSRHIGFCFRNGKQYTFQSYSYATYSQKIGTQAIGASLSCKMTDELIGKYFNSGYSTKQLFAILMAQLMDMDSAQLAQLEDQRCSFCSEALLSQFMHGAQAEEVAQILGLQISDAEKENRIRALHGKETYKLAASYFYKGKIKTASVDARRMPNGEFVDSHGNTYKKQKEEYNNTAWRMLR